MLSIIIPMRNEESYVARCLESVLSQLDDTPECEVLCADGASTDRTRQVVLDYAERDPRVHLVDNPGRIAATGINAALCRCRGSIIIRLDCHASYHPGYFKNCIDLLKRTGADDVGGYIETVPSKTTPVGIAIAAATSSRFGVGNSVFRTGGGEMEVDTVPFGCFRRDVFERLGMYDERLVRNEDLEMSGRIRKSGGRIVISPRIRLTYYMRSTFAEFRRHAFSNGLWNPYMVYLIGGGLSLRHVIPLCFVMSLGILGIGGIFLKLLHYLLLAELGMYATATILESVSLAKPLRASTLLIAYSFAQLHISYGLGSLWGVVSAPFRFGLNPARSAKLEYLQVRANDVV